MEHTKQEYEFAADALLKSFEWQIHELNEFVEPKYNVTISETGLSALFECHYTDEDRRDDKLTFTLLKSDKLEKFVSNVEDHYHSLNQIEII